MTEVKLFEQAHEQYTKLVSTLSSQESQGMEHGEIERMLISSWYGAFVTNSHR
jgi:hypothetical protein